MRYSERENPHVPYNFVPRDRSSAIWRVIIGFVVALGVMLVLNLVPSSVGGEPEASLLSMVAISILCFYIVFLKQQNIDLVTQTEFQNLLFSQAAAVGSLFCVFVKRDGEVVYVNRGLSHVLGDGTQRNFSHLASLLEELALPKPTNEAIQDAVFTLDCVSLPIVISRGSGESIALNLDIAPLARPSGYVVIKGVLGNAPAPSFHEEAAQ